LIKNNGTNGNGQVTGLSEGTGGLFRWQGHVNQLGNDGTINGTNFVGQDFYTFCLETNQSIADPTTFTVASFTTSYLSGRGLTTDLNERVHLLREIYGEYYNLGYLNSNADAGTFQTLIWNLVQNNTTIANMLADATPGSGGGFLTYGGPNRAAAAQGLLADLFNDGTANDVLGSLFVLKSGSNQDQLFGNGGTLPEEPVPAPGGLVLAGLGLLTLGGYRLRRKA
jgi:hypothetical protein